MRNWSLDYILLALLALSQPQQSCEEIEIFNAFESCENYNCDNVIRREKVLNTPLQNDILSHDFNISLNSEELLSMKEYIEVWHNTAESCEVINSSEQNSQELSETVEFSKVLFTTEKNGKESQRTDNFD